MRLWDNPPHFRRSDQSSLSSGSGYVSSSTYIAVAQMLEPNGVIITIKFFIATSKDVTFELFYLRITLSRILVLVAILVLFFSRR